MTQPHAHVFPKLGLLRLKQNTSSQRHQNNLVFQIPVIAILAFQMLGCAIYYRDTESGAEHIWGVGHLAIKATPPMEGKQAVIRKVTLTGIALGIDEDSFGVSLGWNQRERLVILNENTAFTIQRPPSNDFFDFKIGSYPLEFNLTDNRDRPSSTAKEDQQ